MRARFALFAPSLLVMLLSYGSYSKSLHVATSIFPIAAIAEEICGSKVEVVAIVPPGVDPHRFDLTPSAATALSKADLILLVGGDFDSWVTKGGIDQTMVVETYKVIEDSLIPLGKSFNPHFWLDPLLAKPIAAAIANRLESLTPEDSSYYRQNLEIFNSRIDSLDAWIRTRLDSSRGKAFVSLHPSWSYLARRYNLNEAETLEKSPEQEPSLKQIRNAVKKIKKMKIQVILAEEFSNLSLAKSVSEATGAHLLILDPIGGKNIKGRTNYFDLIGYNVERIAKLW